MVMPPETLVYKIRRARTAQTGRQDVDEGTHKENVTSQGHRGEPKKGPLQIVLSPRFRHLQSS
jgi:hypothetical protein